MQFLLLIRVDPDLPPTDDDPSDWVEETTASGARLLGERLRPDPETTTVRVRDGRVNVTDGAPAEVREPIAGFDLIEAPDREEAVRIAAAHPVARFGAVEIRELWPFDS